MPVRICRAELLEGRCLLSAGAVAAQGISAQGVDAPPAVVAAGFFDWPSPVQRVRFEFSEDVTGGIDWRALRLDNLDTGETIPGTFFGTVQVGPTVAERRWLTGGLPAGRYRGTLPAGAVVDRSGAPMAADAVFEFLVSPGGDQTPPSVLSMRYETPPARTQRVHVEFSENVLDSVDRLDLVVTDLTTGRVLPDFRFGVLTEGGAYDPTAVSYHAQWPLPPGPYRAVLRASGIRDEAGNALAADRTLEFTVADDDVTPPAVQISTFTAGERPYVRYGFNEDVIASVDAGDLVLTNETTGQRFEASDFTLLVSDFVLTPTDALWYPNVTLAPGRYTASLAPGGITDRPGNAVAGTGAFSFTVAEVVGSRLFYNNSAYDGRDAVADARDDAAVAPDKEPIVLGPGRAWAPTFANVSSYARGINGVMVDFAGLHPRAILHRNDFHVGAGADPLRPGGLRAPLLPTGVSVRRGAGGTDRVTILWPDGAIRNEWLKVTVLANDNTGLVVPVEFCFGSLVGETGDGAGGLRVTALDLSSTRRALGGAAMLPLTERHDFDRDGRVNALDLVALRRNLNATLNLPVAVQALPGTVDPARATELLVEE